MPATPEDIQQIVSTQMAEFTAGFARDYAVGGSKIRNIKNKVNNPFILALGAEILVYSTLMRSLDSSLGNRLQGIAKAIAAKSFVVNQRVEGNVPVEADKQVADLMTEYVHKQRTPSAADFVTLFPATQALGQVIYRTHESDFHLVRLDDPNAHFLIELKIGGDLDNKKAQSEKRALLEQYAILKHNVGPEARIRLYLATAYNMRGEEAAWNQERVLQFFGQDELLIGHDFWNLICDRPDGNDLVLSAYRNAAPALKAVLEKIVADSTDSLS